MQHPLLGLLAERGFSPDFAFIQALGFRANSCQGHIVSNLRQIGHVLVARIRRVLPRAKLNRNRGRKNTHVMIYLWPEHEGLTVLELLQQKWIWDLLQEDEDLRQALFFGIHRLWQKQPYFDKPLVGEIMRFWG